MKLICVVVSSFFLSVYSFANICINGNLKSALIENLDDLESVCLFNFKLDPNDSSNYIINGELEWVKTVDSFVNKEFSSRDVDGFEVEKGHVALKVYDHTDTKGTCESATRVRIFFELGDTDTNQGRQVSLVKAWISVKHIWDTCHDMSYNELGNIYEYK